MEEKRCVWLMAHKLYNVFQEATYSWVVVCSCGWKEKAVTEKEVRARFVRHRDDPTNEPKMR
jgi:hypothetical protein